MSTQLYEWIRADENNLPDIITGTLAEEVPVRYMKEYDGKYCEGFNYSGGFYSESDKCFYVKSLIGIDKINIKEIEWLSPVSPTTKIDWDALRERFENDFSEFTVLDPAFEWFKKQLSEDNLPGDNNNSIVPCDAPVDGGNSVRQMLLSIYEMLVINIPFYAYGDNEAACYLADQINHTREYIAHELIPYVDSSNSPELSVASKAGEQGDKLATHSSLLFSQANSIIKKYFPEAVNDFYLKLRQMMDEAIEVKLATKTPASSFSEDLEVYVKVDVKDEIPDEEFAHFILEKDGLLGTSNVLYSGKFPRRVTHWLKKTKLSLLK